MSIGTIIDRCDRSTQEEGIKQKLKQTRPAAGLSPDFYPTSLLILGGCAVSSAEYTRRWGARRVEAALSLIIYVLHTIILHDAFVSH
jgi:hypothetical protein